jgi:hypothetical protein
MHVFLYIFYRHVSKLERLGHLDLSDCVPVVRRQLFQRYAFNFLYDFMRNGMRIKRETLGRYLLDMSHAKWLNSRRFCSTNIF